MIRFPEKGRAKDDVLKQMQALREKDVNWQDGRVFGLVYHAGDEVYELLKEAYNMFFSENGLNPLTFPSLRQFETEVVEMAIDLLEGDEDAVGNMTSGGTESILMAVKTARDWARVNRPEISAPEMILPLTAHPAFEKAAHYFNVDPVHVAVGDDFRADVVAAEAAITPNTILMVGSAPSYPQGIVDPITELAQVAQKHALLFHVDACMGGFMLPFVRQLGYPVPDFDFRVPGVTSISADLHKYGYAAKPASLILYRDKDVRRHQLFVYTDWSGGIYASPTMTGSRPGGAIAAAWAVMKHLGMEGYLSIADEVMRAAVAMQEGIRAIEGIEVLGSPAMSVFAIGSDSLNVFEIGDEMTLRGWHMDRQQFPSSLHMTVNFAQTAMVDLFIQDLRKSVGISKRFSLRKAGIDLLLGLARKAAEWLPKGLMSRITSWVTPLITGGAPSPSERSAPMYGMMGTLPNRGDLREIVLDLVEQFTRSQE
jgi:glutamate/tyrosine decarboxylase-like PLP-dependent enzyme